MDIEKRKRGRPKGEPWTIIKFRENKRIADLFREVAKERNDNPADVLRNALEAYIRRGKKI